MTAAELQQQAYLAAVNGATLAAAKLAADRAAVVARAVEAGSITTAFPALSTVMAELLRVAAVIADIDRDTRATAKLVIGSANSLKSTAINAALQLRQAAQQAGASTGRVESAYQAGSGDVVTDASLANVVRAGLGLVYAAQEPARQLEVIAGKIKL